MQEHDDLMELALQRLDSVRIEDNAIVIKIPNHEFAEYDISLGQCCTEHDVVRWVHHLSEKSWVTGFIVRAFIKTVYHHYGWNLG